MKRMIELYFNRNYCLYFYINRVRYNMRILGFYYFNFYIVLFISCLY